MSVEINNIASIADETTNARECIGAGKLKTAISFFSNRKQNGRINRMD